MLASMSNRSIRRARVAFMVLAVASSSLLLLGFAASFLHVAFETARTLGGGHVNSRPAPLVVKLASRWTLGAVAVGFVGVIVLSDEIGGRSKQS
jgi:hypothetical protein